MKAMALNSICNLKIDSAPLELISIPDPIPGEHDILLKVSCCGVCHTELDEVEGRMPPPRFPVIPGH